jgi:hypothetical protein
MSKELATKYNLTEKQALFVRYVSEGVDPTRAAEMAGYDSSNIHARVHELRRTPQVLAAIHAEVRRKLVALAPVALSTIEMIVKDETAPIKVRLDGAKTLLDRAGHIAPRAVVDKGTQELALHELSISELRSLADRLENELAARAKDVNRANDSSPETQSVDEIEDALV